MNPGTSPSKLLVIQIYLIAAILGVLLPWAGLALHESLKHHNYFTFVSRTGPFLARPDGAGFTFDVNDPLINTIHPGQTFGWQSNVIIEPGTRVCGDNTFIRVKDNVRVTALLRCVDRNEHRAGPKNFTFTVPPGALPGPYVLVTPLTISPLNDVEDTYDPPAIHIEVVDANAPK